MDETYRELLRTGLFTNLRLTTTPLPDNTVRLDFSLEEAKAREVGFTLGTGTMMDTKSVFVWPTVTCLAQGDLLLSLLTILGGLIAELLHVDPWLFESPRLNFRTRSYSADREEQGYSKEEYGLRLELNWRAMPHLELGGFIRSLQHHRIHHRSTFARTDRVFLHEHWPPADYRFSR